MLFAMVSTFPQCLILAFELRGLLYSEILHLEAAAHIFSFPGSTWERDPGGSASGGTICEY